MFIRQIKKKNGPNGKTFSQFSLVQNSRVHGVVKQRNILYLGSHEALLDPFVKKAVLEILKSKIFGQPNLFAKNVPLAVQALADSYYNKYVTLYGQAPIADAISIPPAATKADYHKVDISTLQFKDVKSFGAENLCQQMIQKLELDTCLEKLKWEKDDINKALIAICARAIFSSSEHKTAKYLSENSELSNLFANKEYILNHRHLYQLADKLYAHKNVIDKHIYNRVCDWFTLDDKLLIFDISNTYFESPKFDSQLAQYGRSKEKRSDCKIVVFTGVINAQGFIKHSKIYEGNKADVSTLEDMIADLEKHSHNGEKKTVVLDAGIASEANLSLLREKGYKYVCVARAILQKYELDKSNIKQVKLHDKNQTPIQLSIVKQDKYSDTWMYVKSPDKEKKETSMNKKLSTRFIEELESLKEGLHKKGTSKKATKIYERLGRLKQKHKNVSSLYQIEIKQANNLAIDITWTLNMQSPKEEKLKGVYFIRTNHANETESQLWTIYNTIREVESTFRCLKSDLNIRPIHHQLDSRIESHIYLTILAYQLVNTIRHLLIKANIKLDWQNILRLMSTQIIQTVAIHTDTKTIHLRKVSEPTEKVETIYKACVCKPTIKPQRKHVVYH